VIRKPEFELVGVIARSEAKVGRDAGDLVGASSTGVIVTDDPEEIFALEADCVIHTPSDPGDFTADGEILRLLESGKNVITALPYHVPDMRGPNVAQRIEAACEQGGVSFHASGSDPGFMGERLALTLTGVCDEIKYVTLEEVYECSELSDDLLTHAGFGAGPEQTDGRETLAAWANNYLCQVVVHGGRALGVTFDEIIQTTDIALAPHDIVVARKTIEAGTVGSITNSWVGMVGDKPFYTLRTYWYLGERMKPFEVPSRDHWIITIEGNPSARMTLDLKASIEHDIYVTDEERTPAGMIASVIPLMQAIPVTCAHPPGIVQSTVFAHWMRDLRGLVPDKAVASR
jgi:4-hydroxy-tetrahydrodipicolinate reductase